MMSNSHGSTRYEGPRELVFTMGQSSTTPWPGQVLLAPAYVGICGTDLHIYQGHMDGRVAAGTVLGHESSGVIVAIGEDVQGWAAGDHVCVNPVISCGECRTCRSGLLHVCPRLKILGIDASGAMQAEWVVPAENLVRISRSVDLKTACLVEPLAVAVHDVRRSRLAAGERALVVGAGPVGLLIAMAAREVGGRVEVVEVNESRRAAAQALGFDTVAQYEADSVSADGAPDVTFEVSGVAAGLATAYSALTPGGRMVVVGIHSEPRPLDLRSLFEREVEVLGARLYSRADFKHAVTLIENGSIDPSPLVTDVVDIESAGTAFEHLLGGGSSMKILLASTASR